MIKAHDEQPLRKTLKMSHKEKHYRERNLELFRLKKVWLMDLFLYGSFSLCSKDWFILEKR